jgi:hypothetical protein
MSGRGARANIQSLLRLAALALLAVSVGEAQPAIGGCEIFPAGNAWNRPVDDLPVHPHNADYMRAAGRGRPLHIDASMPFNVVGPDQAMQPLSKVEAPAESDPGPFPIPVRPAIEPATDSHMLILQTGVCRLFEIYHAKRQGASWTGANAAIFDLRSNTLRPDGWTSADAAGLPILPGLLRYQEVKSGTIAHAVRMTVPATQRAYVWPARHFASSSADPALPPMGLRLRLRPAFDAGNFSPQARVVLTALKRYGAFVADNGSSFFFTAAPDGWPQTLLDELKRVRSDDFEAVDTSAMAINRDSGQAGPLPSFSEVSIAGSPTLTVNLSQGSVFTIMLAADVKLEALRNLTPGQLVAFRICQDGHGGHRFTWPPAVHGGMTTGSAAGKCSIQTFITAAGGLYAAAPGVIDER